MVVSCSGAPIVQYTRPAKELLQADACHTSRILGRLRDDLFSLGHLARLAWSIVEARERPGGHPAHSATHNGPFPLDKPRHSV